MIRFDYSGHAPLFARAEFLYEYEYAENEVDQGAKELKQAKTVETICAGTNVFVP